MLIGLWLLQTRTLKSKSLSRQPAVTAASWRGLHQPLQLRLSLLMQRLLQLSRFQPLTLVLGPLSKRSITAIKVALAQRQELTRLRETSSSRESRMHHMPSSRLPLATGSRSLQTRSLLIQLILLSLELTRLLPLTHQTLEQLQSSRS